MYPQQQNALAAEDERHPGIRGTRSDPWQRQCVTGITDPPGRVCGVAAVGCSCLQSPPRMVGLNWRITHDGRHLGGPLCTTTLHRADITRIRDHRDPPDRAVRLLEIDTTDDRLFVLTRWDLARPGWTCLDALTAAGYAG